jgi:hypothetical protein
MTLIAQAHGLIVADSCRGTLSGYEYSTGKIFTYPQPALLRSARLKFKDWFYGYAGTGDEEVVKFAGELALSGQLDLWWDRYKCIDEMRFVNDFTTFSIFLFGLDGTLLLEVNSGKIHMQYLMHHQIAQVSIGSGSKAFAKLFTETKFEACPVRTMYGTFTMEPSCGGAVEVWRLPLAVRGKGAGLIKLGEFPHKDLVGCFKMMSTPLKLHFKKESQEWLKSVILRLVKRSPAIAAELTSTQSPKRWVSPLLKSSVPRTVPTSPRSLKSAPSA